MKPLKSFVKHIVALAIVFGVTYITPVLVASIICLDLSMYIDGVRNNAYAVIMILISLFACFGYLVYVTEEEGQ